MITLTSARRRADELAAALDDPTTSAVRPEIAELVGVADVLRAHAAAEAPALFPRPEFTSRLREQLLAEAAESWTYDPSAARLELRARTTTPRRERRLVVAATALLLAGGSAGMAAAAQQALPGEALYPIKRGLEEVRADLTSDDAARGRTLLSQADSRLGEVAALVGESATDPAISSTLETYRSQAREGSGLLLGSYTAGSDADADAVSEVRGFTQDGLAQLDALAAALAPELAEDLRETTRLLETIDADAVEVCPTCRPASARALPVAFEPALDDAARVLASLEGGAELRNDHPLISPRIAPPITMKATPRSSAPGAGTGAGAAPPAEDLGPQEVPEDTGGLLDGLTGGLGSDVSNGGSDTRDLDEQLDDGVREAEEKVRESAEGLGTIVGKTGESLGLDDPRLP
ncbi:hypothetical protein G7072_01130 [Nocardioides sp. HDW12B]|uniref:DUF5667 domain-containing protein n=1 Tax=Nocardioides sp. HDW12B TaxID=2714939 RepID=UPI00140BF48D|nr:DUF5667 domain-containing protein [Nocardioides sp. HDW12B]QIK65125.1 hypothetical protein G7072_01130 [Nocardioides sp. HDW12B]